MPMDAIGFWMPVVTCGNARMAVYGSDRFISDSIGCTSAARLELIKKQQHARAEAHKASEEAKKSTMAQLEASKLRWKIAAEQSVIEQTQHVACF